MELLSRRARKARILRESEKRERRGKLIPRTMTRRLVYKIFREAERARRCIYRTDNFTMPYLSAEES